MHLPPGIDRWTLPLQRLIAEATAPNPARRGYPLFSERIRDRKRRWMVEGQPNPYTAIASKAGGIAYMRSLGHPVPQLYGVYPSLDALPRFDDLPPSFVLKPLGGWSSAGVFLMRDGFDLLRKRSFTRDEVIRTARSYSGVGHKGIAGQWLAEELLLGFDGTGEPATDHKLFCFGPKVVLIRVNKRTGLIQPMHKYWFANPDWTRVPYRVSWKKDPEHTMPERPPFLDDMLRIASDVGGRLNIFIRIDMYATDRGPVFGEFTGYPSGGNNYTPRADAWLGSHWKTLDGGIEERSAP
jgi:hypothetical protein